MGISDNCDEPDQVQRPVLTPSTTKLLSPSGAPLSIKGQFTADTMHKSELFSMEIVVIDGPGSTNLLSRRDCPRLRLIQHLDAAESCTSKPAQPIGCMVGPPADIKLVDDATPYQCGVARRVPLPLQDKVTEELARMEEMGIIVRETDPSDWCSSMVPVRKPNGRVRICVDLKKLNGNVKSEHFPLPTVEDTLARLAGSTVFSTLDANSGLLASASHGVCIQADHVHHACGSFPFPPDAIRYNLCTRNLPATPAGFPVPRQRF